MTLNIEYLKNLSEAVYGDEYYQSKISYWNKLKLAFDGGSNYTDFALIQNPLESLENYRKRLRTAYYFNHPATVIGLYSFSIMEQEPKSTYGDLANDPIWKMFNQNSDQVGTNLKDFIDRCLIFSSVFGHVGVLINKPEAPENCTIQQQKDLNLIPYLTMYPPTRILSALFQRNVVSHKIELVYLKLRDLDDRIQVWTKDRVVIYQLNKTNKEITDTDERSIGIIYDQPNPFDNEIPFVFMKNLYNPDSLRDGLSDLREIELISSSIVRNCSIAEEIFDQAGFPMMRKPMLADGQDDPDEAGPTAIMEFDPQYGEAGKPDWLKPEVLEPISAMISWIERKIDEIYKLAFLSGMHQQSKGSQVKSGVALRYELKQLSSILTQKTKAMTELEIEVIRMFLKWQNKDSLFAQVNVSRPVDFSIDELMDNFEMLTKSLDHISSDEYNVQVQKRIIQFMLPGADKNIIETIYKELYSTRTELLCKRMSSTSDETHGIVHIEAENAQKLAKINAQAMADAAASKTAMPDDGANKDVNDEANKLVDVKAQN